MDYNNMYFGSYGTVIHEFYDTNGRPRSQMICYKKFSKFVPTIETIVCVDDPDNILVIDKENFCYLCSLTPNQYKKLPNELKIKNLSDELFAKDKNFFELIPDKHKTLQMCIEACEFNINFIKYVPDEFKTRELYRNTLSKFSSNFIKDKFDLEFELFDI